jgi:hypothetical protein
METLEGPLGDNNQLCLNELHQLHVELVIGVEGDERRRQSQADHLAQQTLILV